VQCFTEWNFAEGLPQLEKAKMLAPANPTANDLLGRIVVYLGRVDEAERQARQAVELDPFLWRRSSISVASFSMPENWMKQTRAGAKWQKYSRLPLESPMAGAGRGAAK
jgi:Flp pilus assembly protein TadD, contains TPR repeats